jgi:hypothetical protein
VTYEKLQRAYGEHSLSRAQVFRWNKSFLEGRDKVEDEPHAGRPPLPPPVVAFAVDLCPY